MFDRVYIEEAKKKVGEQVTIAGWVVRTRDLAKIKFIVMRDKTGEIQVTVKNLDLFPKEGLGQGGRHRRHGQGAAEQDRQRRRRVLPRQRSRS